MSADASSALAARPDGTVGSARAAKLRVRYAKQGKIRFVSAIDLTRIWERALRKAELPIAYSEGFSPHPKVSFADALPLGYASVAEYAELTFAGEVLVAPAVRALNAAFPDGIDVLDAVPVQPGDPRISTLLRASCWDLTYPGAAHAQLADAADAAAAAERLPVLRQRKGEPVEVDLRPALHAISVHDAVVRVVLHHVEPPVRPSEVELALGAVSQPSATPAPPLPPPTLVTRVGQGRAVEGGMEEALRGTPVPALPNLERDPRDRRDQPR